MFIRPDLQTAQHTFSSCQCGSAELLHVHQQTCGSCFWPSLAVNALLGCVWTYSLATSLLQGHFQGTWRGAAMGLWNIRRLIAETLVKDVAHCTA